jgi:hypothetical protein
MYRFVFDIRAERQLWKRTLLQVATKSLFVMGVVKRLSPV